MNRRSQNRTLYDAMVRVLMQHLRMKSLGVPKKRRVDGGDKSGQSEPHGAPGRDLRNRAPRDPRDPPRLDRGADANAQPPINDSAPKTKPRDPRYPPRLRYIPNTGANCPKCGGNAPKGVNGRPYCRRCGPFPIRKPYNE
jgi:hypothetical protein